MFEEFLAQCARGLTPNPDLACNRHIKFDALLDFADSLKAPLVATGGWELMGSLGLHTGVCSVPSADLCRSVFVCGLGG